MNTKKHGKVTMALVMIGGLAALSIAYAAISTQLNIRTNGNSEKVEASAVMFDETEGACKGYGVSKPVDSSGVISASNEYEDTQGKQTDNDLAKCGSVVVGSSNKRNDTVTINGTILRDYGAFAVYKLTIVNRGSTPVQLTKNPNSNDVIKFTSDTKSEIQKNVTIGVYENPECTSLVYEHAQIAGGASTTWYVKVAHRAYGTEYGGSNPTDISYGNDTQDITSGPFGFTITPVWENVQ